jgi:arylsulfatase A-like enzyme
MSWAGIDRRIERVILRFVGGVVGLAGVVAILATACDSTAPERPNFLLVSIDTLRADHLGAYGYERDTSPNLDRFARRGLRFERALAPAPWTLPSHVAMLSGQHPHDVGIDDIDSSIPERVPMMAQALSAGGYQTAAFVDSASGGLLGGERGFNRGFDRYDHAPHARTPGSKSEGPKYDASRTVDAGLAWLRERDHSRPFFLFLHTKSVHTAPVDLERTSDESDAPYRSPEPFGSRYLPEGRTQFAWHEGERPGGVRYLREMNQHLASGEIKPEHFPAERLAELVALYDGGIRYVDEQFGRLLATLGELGLSENTVVIVTADHGEAFLEHYFFLHKEIFASQVWVPLLVLDPAVEQPSVESRSVSLMDIVPTILSRAGLSVSPQAAGRNLLSADSGITTPARPLFSYSRIRREPLYEAYSLEVGRHRLIYHKHRTWEQFRADLFDRKTDPDEQSPLTDESDLKNAMLGQLIERMKTTTSGTGQRIEIDQQSLESLRALGYVD